MYNVLTLLMTLVSRTKGSNLAGCKGGESGLGNTFGWRRMEVENFNDNVVVKMCLLSGGRLHRLLGVPVLAVLRHVHRGSPDDLPQRPPGHDAPRALDHDRHGRPGGSLSRSQITISQLQMLRMSSQVIMLQIVTNILIWFYWYGLVWWVNRYIQKCFKDAGSW